jgi:fused signal recognition particle receptor
MLGTLFRKSAETAPDAETGAQAKPGLLDRMRLAVTRTREGLQEKMGGLLTRTQPLDETALQQLQALLIASDVGVRTATEILTRLRAQAAQAQIQDGAQLRALLQAELLRILESVQTPAPAAATAPEILFLVGVNGTGKTTTTGKLAAHLRAQGKSVLLCAADTFRAAAIEQLAVWSDRAGVELIRTKPGGDPSAALFDALQAAKARSVDVVLVDTAGRLHTKNNLMAELEKMRRTAQRFSAEAPHQTLLVMDATTGQNGLQQARQFQASAAVNGIVLTKLDGTAKGGIVVAIAQEMGVPVRYMGVGEQMDGLLPFDAHAFVDSLLGR